MPILLSQVVIRLAADGDRARIRPALLKRLRADADAWCREAPGRLSSAAVGSPPPRAPGRLVTARLEARALGVILRPGVYRWLRIARLHRLLTAATRGLVAPEGSVLVLVGAGGRPEDVLEAGRALLRSWLGLGRAGLNVHPLSQILDAPRTAAELSRRVRVEEGEEALCVFRAGRSAPPARSRRLR